MGHRSLFLARMFGWWPIESSLAPGTSIFPLDAHEASLLTLYRNAKRWRCAQSETESDFTIRTSARLEIDAERF
jgi:hypothetical protein